MCRSVLLSCLLLLPASLAAQLPLPKEAWFDRFGRQRGMLLLVGPQAGWLQRLHDPAQEDLLAELSIEQTSPLDPALAAFGIPGAGAYLFNEAGRLLKSWPSGAPSDLRAALAEAGWISRSESLELALKDHRQRLDLLARLFQTQWRRAHQRPAPENLDRVAGALERLLLHPQWTSHRTRLVPPLVPPPGFKESEPLRLREVARARIEEVREALRQDPESLAAWEMLAFLSAWYPGDEPRLFRFLEGLEPPPDRFPELLEWPGIHALELAEAQLRRLGDWAGLEAFAQGRANLVYAQAGTLAPEAPSVWAVRMGWAPLPGRRFPPGSKSVRMAPFSTESARMLGRWLILLLEAQLKQERLAPAAGTLSLLLRDGTEGSWREARGLLVAAKADGLVRQLDAGTN